MLGGGVTAWAAPVDVTTVGMFPNDGLDDSAALTQALQAHEELFFPAGVYDMAQTVYIPSLRRLTGAGRDLVKLLQPTARVFFRVEGQQNIRIEEMTFERPTSAQSSREEMIFIYAGSRDVELHRLRVHNARSRAPSLLAINSYDIAFTECEITDTQMVIFEENAWQVYGSAISCTTSTGVFIEGCVATESRDMVAEWAAKPAAERTKYNWYQAGAIQVSSSSHVVVRNNVVTTSGNGIDMGGAAPALVEGNLVDQCHETGIKVVNGANNQVIRNNRVTRCGLIGIWITPGSTNVSARSCLVEGNILGQIGEGIGGNGYWSLWFNETVPAGIHFQTSTTAGQRSRDHVVTGNRFYETASMRIPAVMIQPGTRSALNVTESDNLVVAGATPALSAPPSSTGYVLPPLVPVNLDSFSDTFARADGAPGSSYVVRDGAPFVISGGALQNGGAAQNLTIVPAVTLPDAAAYAIGERFNVSVDMVVPNNTASSVPTFGVLLNFRDSSNYHGVRFRGDANATSFIQFFRRVGGVESVPFSSPVMDLRTNSVNPGPYSVYRLEIGSDAPGLYRYTFRRLGWTYSSIVLAGGYFDAGSASPASALAGGQAGVYTDNAAAGAYTLDNLSIEVSRPLVENLQIGSFLDTFTGTDGPSLGSNWVRARGETWQISNNTAVLTNASVTSVSFLRTGTLPTTADYANGATFTTGMDFRVTPNSGTNTPALGLVLNFQDTNNWSGVRWRGDGNNRLQAVGQSVGVNQSANLAAPGAVMTNFNAWYTLRVTSPGPGVYNYSLLDRQSQAILTSGVWQPATNNQGSFAGGYVGICSDSGTVYEVDNFTLSVEMPVQFGWAATSGAWSTPSNWTNGVAPSNSALLLFGGAGGQTTNNLAALESVFGVVFSNTGSSYFLTGGPLAVGSKGIVNGSTNSHTISNHLSLSGDAAIMANTGGLELGGNVTNSAAGRKLTVGGAANTLIRGALSGAGSLIKSGSGTLVLSGSSTYAGGTDLQAGKLLLSGGSNRLSSAGSISISNGAQLDLGGQSQTLSGLIGAGMVTNSAGTLTVDLPSGTNVFSGSLVGAGSLAKSGAGTLLLSGSNSFSGGLAVNRGTVILGAGGSLGAGPLTIAANSGQLRLQPSSDGGFTLSDQPIFVSGSAIPTNQLTGFSDNFDRASGAVGTNYIQRAGSPFVVTNNALLRTGIGEDLTVLNVGSLPDAPALAAGYGFSASVDLFFQSETVSRLFGLLVNYQNNSNYTAFAIRGDGNNVLQIRGRTNNGGNISPASVLTGMNYVTNTWYTLGVSSSAPNVYNLTWAVRGQSPHKWVVFTNTNTVLTGGSLGFYADTGAPGTNNFFDNLSVTVTSPGLAFLHNEAGTNTYQGPITLGASGKIVSAVGSRLNLDVASGPAIEATNRSLELAVDGLMEIRDPVVLGQGSLTKTGAGTVFLASTNSYAGPTTVTGGALVVPGPGYSATIGTNVVTVAFAAPPPKGVSFQLLPGALAGNPPVSGTGLSAGQFLTLNPATSTVTVDGANTPPSIVGGQTFSIAEGSAAGTVVGTVLANDFENDPLSGWALVAGNDGGAFSIDGNGVLSVSGALDHGSIPAYNLGVTVSDGAETSLVGQVAVAIIDPPGYADAFGSSAPGADANGDGVPNLVAYAFGASSPGNLTASMRPVFTRDGGFLRLVYRVRLGDPDLHVVPEQCAALGGTWDDTGLSVHVLELETVGGVLIETREVAVPLQGASQFLRLRVSTGGLLSETSALFVPPPAGGADAAPALRAALLQSDNVRLLDGATYPIGSFVVIGSNKAVSGAASLVPTFDLPVQASDANATLILEGENIRLQGLSIAKPFIDGSYGMGVLVRPGSRNVFLRDLEISGYSARYGIIAVDSVGVEITGCTVRDFMMNASADMIRDSPAGIALKRCTNSVVLNNEIRQIEVGPQGRASISPLVPTYGPQGYQSDHIFAGQCVGVLISGNTMQTSGEGIDVLLSRQSTVTGNTIDDIWFQGVKMLGASSLNVSRNTISNCYQGIGLATHPLPGGECENNTVTGNSIFNTGTPGSFGVPAPGRVPYGVTAAIYVDGTSRSNTITFNTIANPDPSAQMTAAIQTNSQPNTITNNVVP